MKHSWLDFTAAGTANDFFHTFSNYISGKNILSTFLGYATVAVLILLIIIILPCIVRILRQRSIQRLATELHLAVLRNKKGGDARSQWGISLVTKVMRKEDRHTQRPDRASGVPPDILENLPSKNQSLPTLLLCALTSDFTGDCPLPPSRSLCQRVNLQLQLIKFLGN